MFPSGSPQRFQAAGISLSTGQKHWRKPPGREADRMNWPEGKAVCGEQSIKVIDELRSGPRSPRASVPFSTETP